jgi:uncharacterized repeat protein (TIGR01451 family)
MLKKLLLLLTVTLLSSQLKAQFVTINDPLFVAWLTYEYPTCMSGSQMDTTCSDIINEAIVNVDYEGISDLQGIEYFDNLALLFAYGNNLSTLPVLNQTSLVNLQVGSNDLTSIPNFPPNLLILNISSNPSLLSTPALPSSLYSYDGSNNPNLPFPAWPSGLLDLKLGSCGLTSVPSVPSGLETFFLQNNPLLGNISPGQIPNTVTNLAIGNCGLTLIPILPPNLESLSIWQNSISTVENLPATLMDLHAMNNPNITQLNGLPDSMNYFNFDNCNISIVDSLPTYCPQIDLNDNQIISIPNFPVNMNWFHAENNNISSIPPFPVTMQYLNMNNNDMYCWPIFLQAMTNMAITGNPFTCLPNKTSNMSNPFFDAYPLCDYNDPVNNPQGCSTAEGIEGFVFSDDLLDCTYNGSENGYQNVTVRLFDGGANVLQTTSTSSLGQYFLLADQGTYDVVVDTLNMPFTISCAAPGVDSTVSIVAPDSLVQDVNFGMICKPGFDVGTKGFNLNNIIFPGQAHTLTVRSGDLSNFYGLNCAAGVAGNVTIEITGPVQYVGNPASSLTPTVGLSTYSYTIPDFGLVDMDNDFQLTFLVDTTALSGDLICMNVNVTPVSGDNVSANNIYSACYSVVNSYDPNNKLVTPETVEPGYDDYLTYTINFQNTGSAPAFNIRLEDTLSPLVDLSTFEVIGYSHDSHFNLIDNKLIVFYPNIMLEDSTTNEPESKGFFQYRVRPMSGLTEGTTVENTAHIFFDYNAPITTNTAVTSYEIDDTGINEIEYDLSIFPNPSNGQFYVTLNGSGVLEKVSVIDELGREIPVRTSTGSTYTTIELVNKATGLFIVNVTTNSGTVQKRILIK